MSCTGELQQSLPDAILEDIFLRLDDAADVVRASAACKSHRRVVCDSRFLRRYRFLHPPPVLGFLESMETGVFLHAEPPHKSALAASSLAQAADFTFSFLPMEPNTKNRSWCVRDARDGRVLLSRRSSDHSSAFMDLVICDPLYRRYIQIPPIPEELVPKDKQYNLHMKYEPFLLPAREEENESQFQVIYNWLSGYKVIAFLFNSDTRKWRLATSFAFVPDKAHSMIHNLKRSVRHYVDGCFCWLHRYLLSFMLVFDPLKMEFSITDPPFKGLIQGMAFVDARMNGLGKIVYHHAQDLYLYSKIKQNNNGSPQKLQYEKHLPFPEGYACCNIIGAAEGYVLLEGINSLNIVTYFLLDPKTFLIEMLCKWEHEVYQAIPYARFPPSLLSPPTI